MGDDARGGDAYAIPAADHVAERVVSRSRFRALLAAAATPAEAHAVITRVRAEFPDATHHCWAFVAGPPGSSAQIGLSDDGEPHGTAGRPMLTVLQHAPVGDVVAVVTRWYGGTKLGTGGLARAYGGAVQDALATLPTTRRVTWSTVRARIDYAHVDTVRQLLASLDGEVDDMQYEIAVTIAARVPAASEARWWSALDDATRGQAQRLA